MTDPKRITLPGPGSQPSHPAPEPPPEATATAVLGTLPSGTPVERSSPLLPAIDDDEDEGRPGFNPFKFQRITVPPGLRADMIRWSREGKAEQPPEEALDGEESNLESSGETDEGDDASVAPVGGSGAPRLPLRSVRGVALAAGLVILPLAVLGLATALRRHPNATVNAHDAAAQSVGETPEAASPTPPPIATAKRALAAPAAVTATTAPSAAPTAPRSTAVAHPPTNASRPVTRPTRPTHSAETAPAPAPNENALDRPFSLPK